MSQHRLEIGFEIDGPLPILDQIDGRTEPPHPRELLVSRRVAGTLNVRADEGKELRGLTCAARRNRAWHDQDGDRQDP